MNSAWVKGRQMNTHIKPSGSASVTSILVSNDSDYVVWVIV